MEGAFAELTLFLTESFDKRGLFRAVTGVISCVSSSSFRITNNCLVWASIGHFCAILRERLAAFVVGLLTLHFYFLIPRILI